MLKQLTVATNELSKYVRHVTECEGFPCQRWRRGCKGKQTCASLKISQGTNQPHTRRAQKPQVCGLHPSQVHLLYKKEKLNKQRRNDRRKPVVKIETKRRSFRKRVKRESNCLIFKNRTPKKMCSASSKHPHSGVERFGDGEKLPLSPSISPKPFRPQRPRPRRVLYPPGLRKIVPKEESDPARCWLVLLSALLFFQIYMEEGLCDTQGIPDRPQAQDDQSSMLEENPFSQAPSEVDVAQCGENEQSCNLYWEMRSCF